MSKPINDPFDYVLLSDDDALLENHDDLNLLDDDLLEEGLLEDEMEELLDDEPVVTTSPPAQSQESVKAGEEGGLADEFAAATVPDSSTEENDAEGYQIKNAADARTFFFMLALLQPLMIYEHNRKPYLVGKSLQQATAFRAFSSRKIPVLCVDRYGQEFLWLVNECYLPQLKQQQGTPVRAAWDSYHLVFQPQPHVEIFTDHIDTNPNNVIKRYFPEEHRISSLEHPVARGACA